MRLRECARVVWAVWGAIEGCIGDMSAKVHVRARAECGERARTGAE
jgi:hypothetical protein